MTDTNTPEGREHLTVTCWECGKEHEATYSHEGQWNQGPIYAVVCDDGLTDYYTAEVVRTVTK